MSAIMLTFLACRPNDSLIISMHLYQTHPSVFLYSRPTIIYTYFTLSFALLLHNHHKQQVFMHELKTLKKQTNCFSMHSLWLQLLGKAI